MELPPSETKFQTTERCKPTREVRRHTETRETKALETDQPPSNQNEILERWYQTQNLKITASLTPEVTAKKTRTPSKTALCLPCLTDCSAIQSRDIRITSLLKSCPVKEWNNSGTCLLMAWCLACTC
jgi:hypothetical protein